MTRKPTSKEPAEAVLNRFLQKEGILIAFGDMPVSRSTDGSVTIRSPKPTAVYKDDVPKTPPVSSENGEK